MSTSKRPGSSWVSVNYDKLVLSILLVVLAASSLFLVARVGASRQAAENASWRQGPAVQAAVTPIDLGGYEVAKAAVTNPFQVSSRQQSLATSELRVGCVNCGKPIPFNATVCPFCRAKQPEIMDPEKFDGDGDGLPDEVEKQLGLNPMDPTDGSGDLDGDGFTNAEEYVAKTPVDDATKFPPPVAKLRVARTWVNPFMLRFLGVQQLADGDRYQLNARTLDRTYFARIGEELEGYTVGSYEPDAQGGPTLIMTQNGRSVRLVKGQVVQQDARNARVVSLLDASGTNVMVNSTLKIKDFEYKVVDIQESRVVLRDASTGAETAVVPLSEDDKSRLQGGPGGGVQDSLIMAPSPAGVIR